MADEPSIETDSDLAALALSTLSYAAVRDYTGWDYADGLSSRLRRALPFEHKLVNLAFQETIKRFPVNVRPLFAVEQRQSFKGTGLFALAHLRLADYVDETGIETPFDHRAEARRLLDWLLDNRSQGYSGFCGGHKHENQHLDHKTYPNEPDVVATAYAVQALLAGASLDDRYADVARTTADFLIEDMDYREVPGGAKIDYYPKDTGPHYTLNAGALAAHTFLDLYDYFGDEDYRDRATALLDYVVSKQTELGGWYYRDPPRASHLSMDTHHNGFIIECLMRHHEVVPGERYADALDAAITCFRDHLFEPNGAPNWDESSRYPKDIHAATQGIIVFAKLGDHETARRIIDWTCQHLYAGDGRFYYRKHRYFTRRTTLMRWCQAWMSYALAVAITEKDAEHR